MAQAKEWLILKSVVTNDMTKLKRIGHGDGGLGTVEYYERISEIINSVINAGLVNAKGRIRYDAGEDNGFSCLVDADGTGITAEQYGGGVRIVVPDTVMIFSFRLKGDASFLDNNELEITIYGGYLSNSLYNTESANSFHPFLSAVSRNQLSPSDPFVQRPHDAGGLEIFHLPITTPQICISQIIGLSGDWEVMGLF